MYSLKIGVVHYLYIHTVCTCTYSTCTYSTCILVCVQYVHVHVESTDLGIGGGGGGSQNPTHGRRAPRIFSETAMPVAVSE